MAIITDISVFLSGYMGNYRNAEATPTSPNIQITIDGVIVQSQVAEIPANDSVCLFGTWDGIDTLISHEICAIVEVACPIPTASFFSTAELCK